MSLDFVRIFDTTLRDGEQSPGATMTQDEKIRIARKLDAMGVDVIEAGFPAASPGEIRSVQALSHIATNAEIAGLCRTRENDIRATEEALKFAKKPRFHVFIATSDIHLQYKLKMTREEVLEQIKFGVGMCRSLCERVEFSAEDASRTDMGFLKEAMACALENGATVLNVPDTVGYTMPEEFQHMIGEVVKVTQGTDAIVSAHCHNDLGLAVANSLAAVKAGARQIECCINGLGERAGNAALEEIVMSLRTRADIMNVQTRVDATQLTSVSRLVSEVTGMVVQPNKAIVGRNAFAHEAGIHQHGVLEERSTYEIMTPESVGISESNLVLGKHSGRHALRDHLETLGYRLTDAELKVVFKDFKDLADRKKNIYDEDLHALVGSSATEVESYYELTSVEFNGGSSVEPGATVSLIVDGVEVSAHCTGDGPVNAALEAVKRCAKLDNVTLLDYSISAITGGSDAQGRVNVRIDYGGEHFQGQSTDTDVVVASAEAFVSALNRAAWHRDNPKVSAQGAEEKREAS
jgi:2-isopropylmalate synthase